MHKLWIGLFVFIVTGLNAMAADRIAVAQPVTKGGVDPNEVESLWAVLESSVGGNFELISRAAFKPMLTEIGLTDASGLVNLNSEQKAKLGEIKTVKYLLVTTIGRIGGEASHDGVEVNPKPLGGVQVISTKANDEKKHSRYILSLMVVDASTGEIHPDMRMTETFQSLAEIPDRIPDMLQEMNLIAPVKTRGVSAMLTPLFRSKQVPAYVSDEFNSRIESGLLEGDVRLRNLKSVNRILEKNGIGDLEEAEPALYRRVGTLLRSDYLIQPVINRFEIASIKVHIEASNSTVVSSIGNVDGSIRIIETATGEIKATIPFRQRVDFDDVQREEDTEKWLPEDYGKYVIEKAVSTIVQKTLDKLKK